MRRSTPRHTPLTRLATATNSFGKRRSFIYAVDRTGSNTTRQSPYIYDVNNQRIAKTVDLDGQGANPATTTRFVYDRNNVALEFTGSATVPSTRYFHGTNVDQVLAQESSNTTTWLLSDQIGTTRDLVNNSGTLLNHFTYDSFGNQTGSTPNATVDTRYKFTGREFDGETGDYFYRSRYYDPEVGRFLGEDAIGFGGGDANLYRYVRNSSINRVDPLGTRDARWPFNASVTNRSSKPVIILNSNDMADYLETLQPGQATPDSMGRSKDTDGVWVCRNKKWIFYGIYIGNVDYQIISVDVPMTVGGSVSLPVFTPKDVTLGDVTVTDDSVRDRGGRIISPDLPQNRGRMSSNTPPGGSFNCSCINQVANQYRDASVWRPVELGDEWSGNQLERSIYETGNQINNLGNPAAWRFRFF
jgi:RHS repeat-associated protein